MTQRLRVERPCRVRRIAVGSWGWTCWLCPAPLRDLVSTAESQAQAQDEVDEHLRQSHSLPVVTRRRAA